MRPTSLKKNYNDQVNLDILDQIYEAEKNH
jgi:hypothetical protein